jgi:hypothetical protein
VPYVSMEVFANLATTTVTVGGTGAPLAGTVETWTVSSASSFPAAILNATQFHIADTAAGYQGEMITVLATSGTTWTVLRGAEATTPLAHLPGFTVVAVTTAGALAALQYHPWEFPVEATGAVGDGIIGAGGTGTAGTATFTDAAAAFVNAPAPLGSVGKLIIINQGAGGSATNPFTGSIIAVNSGTSVTLSANLAANCANAPYVYGTDDSVAINTAITNAANWATSTGNYKAQVLFQPALYMTSGITQATTPYQFNCHFPVPQVAQYGRKLIIDLIGVGDASEPDYWESVVPNLQGTCIVSTSFVTTQPDATYGFQSVFGGPTSVTGLSPGLYGNTLFNISGISIVCPWNSMEWGGDFRYLGQANAFNAAALAFAPVNYNGQPCGGPFLTATGGTGLPANGQSVGFAFPSTGNNDNCNFSLITVEGFAFGLSMSEHVTGQRAVLIYCGTCLYFTGGTGSANPNHGFAILYASCEASAVALQMAAPGPVFIGVLDCEVITTTHVSDASNYITGYVGVFTLANVAQVITGGLNGDIRNLNISLGAWNTASGWPITPAAPASGVAQANNSGLKATVWVTSTAAITAVAIDGNTMFTGSVAAGVPVPVPVPARHTYTVTSAGGTLTTHWELG